MAAWFAENGTTVAVVTVLILLFGAAVYSMIRRKKRGKSGCGCGCEHCAAREFCHTPPDETE